MPSIGVSGRRQGGRRPLDRNHRNLSLLKVYKLQVCIVYCVSVFLYLHLTPFCCSTSSEACASKPNVINVVNGSLAPPVVMWSLIIWSTRHFVIWSLEWIQDLEIRTFSGSGSSPEFRTSLQVLIFASTVFIFTENKYFCWNCVKFRLKPILELTFKYLTSFVRTGHYLPWEIESEIEFSSTPEWVDYWKCTWFMQIYGSK